MDAFTSLEDVADVTPTDRVGFVVLEPARPNAMPHARLMVGSMAVDNCVDSGGNDSDDMNGVNGLKVERKLQYAAESRSE